MFEPLKLSYKELNIDLVTLDFGDFPNPKSGTLLFLNPKCGTLLALVISGSELFLDLVFDFSNSVA